MIKMTVLSVASALLTGFFLKSVIHRVLYVPGDLCALALIRIEGDGFIIWEPNSVWSFLYVSESSMEPFLGHEVFNDCLFLSQRRRGAKTRSSG